MKRRLTRCSAALSFGGLVAFCGSLAPAEAARPAFLTPESLPRVAGTMTVRGIESPVEIVRDRHHIPHIFAKSDADGYFALGFVHAQDRLWQMEFNRRLSSGRLSEILGKATLGTDRFFRTIGIYHYSKRALDTLDKVTLAALDAYTAGVNAYLAARKGPLPPEFLILKHQPEPWRPADSVAWMKVMAWGLATDWQDEMLRAAFAAKLGAGRLGDLYPARPREVPRGVVLPKFASLYRDLPFESLLALGREFSGGTAASNNWVVGPNRSVTGKPFLANDPHLSLGAPSIWYLAHIDMPSGSLIGGTLAGVPMVAIGRNKRVAWGLTNVMADVQDTYIERLAPGDANSYVTPDGPRAFEVRDEVIKVKGGGDVKVAVRSTRHGVVISDAAPSAAKFAGEGKVLALAWTGLSDRDTTIASFVHMATAKTGNEFVAALRKMETILLSAVYADVDGNFGYQATGKIPIRADAKSARTLPVPGWKATHDWVGFIPFDALPKSVNPASGAIFTANHNLVGDDYPYYVTTNWVPGYRARRISELLQAREKHSAESFKTMQADVTSVMALELLPHVRDVDVGGAAARARDLLRGWDGRMDRARPEPLIFASWHAEFMRLAAADELGPLYGAFTGGHVGFRRGASFVRRVFKTSPKWCDDVTTERKESCAEISARALTAAAEKLVAKYGGEPDAWRWGTAHAARHKHDPLGGNPKLGGLFNIVIESSGGPFTVNAAPYPTPGDEPVFTQVHGPGLRIVVDLSNPDRSVFIQTTGQSGNQASEHYKHFAELWRNVEYVPMVTDRKMAEQGAVGTLTLQPH